MSNLGWWRGSPRCPYPRRGIRNMNPDGFAHEFVAVKGAAAASRIVREHGARKNVQGSIHEKSRDTRLHKIDGTANASGPCRRGNEAMAWLLTRLLGSFMHRPARKGLLRQSIYVRLGPDIWEILGAEMTTDRARVGGNTPRAFHAPPAHEGQKVSTATRHVFHPLRVPMHTLLTPIPCCRASPSYLSPHQIARF